MEEEDNIHGIVSLICEMEEDDVVCNTQEALEISCNLLSQMHETIPDTQGAVSETIPDTQGAVSETIPDTQGQ